MSTKSHPGKFDCYAAADPDEEMFILLGRDPMAGALVRAWANQRACRGEDPAKVTEARECADKLDAWALKLGKSLIQTDHGQDAKSSLAIIAGVYDKVSRFLTEEERGKIATDVDYLGPTVGELVDRALAHLGRTTP